MSYTESASKKKLFIVGGAFLLFVFILYKAYSNNRSQPVSAAQVAEAQAQAFALANWDERLLACNSVLNAEPSDAMSTCIDLAKNGNIEALKRVTWAYSRAGEYLNWNEVISGLKRLSKIDRESQLLLFALMKFMSNDPDVNRQGETGIKRLANKNIAPANVLLASLYALKENTLEQTSNVLWLLERAYNSDPDTLSPIDLALIYTNGLVSDKDIDKAREVLNQAADAFFPIGTNNVAWFLATLDNNPFTEDERAITLSTRIIEDPRFETRHTYVDTLAASYAAAGQFEQAVKYQQQAIDLIADLNWNESNKAREMADFTERLTLYKNEQTVVEYSLKIEKEAFFLNLRKDLVNQLLNTLFVTFQAPVFSETSSDE